MSGRTPSAAMAADVARVAGAAVCVIAIAAGGLPAAAATNDKPQPVKRLVVALYDSDEEKRPRDSRIHKLATMPLNHLGLVVRLYDVRKGLPSADVMKRARGVLTWFSNRAVPDAKTYLKWANAQMANGKRFVILGHPGLDQATLSSALEKRLFNLLFARIGVQWSSRWVALTYDTKVVNSDSRMIGLERKLPKILPAYPSVSSSGAAIRSHLTVEDKRTQRRSDLVITGPKGGYIAAGYALVLAERNDFQMRAWIVNPFKFFARAFGTDAVPKPDTTTLSGRRMYYSHVDGDAWHNITRIERYRDTRTVSAAVHYEWVVKGFPDLPVTIGPVTGDLLKSWYGDAAAKALARKFFREPNVEIGSHTHSHPFAWGFFRNYSQASEVPYLNRYPRRPGKSRDESVFRPSKSGGADPAKDRDRSARYKLSRYYSRPRAYAVKPFDLRSEIAGSVRYLNELAPPGKKVTVLQWSGNTSPFPAAIKMVRTLGLRNINGGDPRMDGRYRSYAWVSGIGRNVGGHWQIYSSGANENIYTDGWTKNFSAFRQVIDTFRNTETPIRIKPINLYYHFYIMERSNSARALMLALRYARTQQIAPVTTSKFAAIGDGFFSTRIALIGKDRWQVNNRDGVETIRFDNATLKTVDFSRSSGVVGHRHFQGSLYVALDASDRQPVVALKADTVTDRPAAAAQPYLVQSRWRVFSLRRAGDLWQFDTQGFGTGQFEWHLPKAGRYRVRITTLGKKPVQEDRVVASRGLRLRFEIKTNDAKRRRIKVSFVEPPQ